MKAKEVLKLIAGSIVVYAIVVACGTAANNQGYPVADGGASSGAASSGSPTGSGMSDAAESTSAADAFADSTSSAPSEGSVGRILDALTDPVPAAKADPYQSGTRLKARYYAGSDGSKVLNGIYDSQLMATCFYAATADGTTRCFPSGLSSASLGSSFYSDSGCSQELAVTSASGCAVPQYATAGVLAAGSCPAQYVYHLYPIAGAYTGAIYSGTPTSCNAISPMTLSTSYASYAFYTVGAEVSPSQWVQGTVQTDP
jgi:hypothetical protein